MQMLGFPLPALFLWLFQFHLIFSQAEKQQLG